MKKNLISIIILALLVVNIILTAIMMFSVTSASRKTASLVDNIASALNLELTAKTEAGENVVNVSIADTDTYSISEDMTIPLKKGEDGEDHYCLLSIGFSINKKDKAYKTYGADLSAQETLIKDRINTVFGQYTIDEARGNESLIKQEILESVQELFESEFIFDVSFSSILYS